MKKLLIALVTLLVLCGCASTSQPVENDNPGTGDVTRDLDPMEEGISAGDSETAVTKALPAHDSKLLTRINAANTGNDTINDLSENEVIARSDVSKGNGDFNEFMDFVNQALYENVDNANHPAVKYIVGEWTFAIVGKQELIGVDFDEVGFAELDLNLDTGLMTLILHPRILHYEYELYSETDEDAGYLPFSGFRQEDSSFLLDDNDGLLVSIRNYYEIEGREFVRAKMYVSEEAYADVLLFRTNQ